MAETFADLLREVGIEDNPGYTPGPYRRGYRPGAELPRYDAPRARPQGGSYAQERQFRMEGARDRFLRQGDLGAAGELALDMTGLPALAQAGRAFRAGDAQSGVTEGATGALQLAGTLSPLPNRGLFGRRLGGPPALNATPADRVASEFADAAKRRIPLAERGFAGVQPAEESTLEDWWRLVDQSQPERATLGLGDLTATQDSVADNFAAVAAANQGRRPVVIEEGGRRYIIDGHHRALAAPDGRLDVDLYRSNWTPPGEAPPQPQAMPRLFGRARDGSVLPMREPQPFRRTAATSGDLREAARPQGGERLNGLITDDPLGNFQNFDVTPSVNDPVAMRMERARRMGVDVDTPLYHGAMKDAGRNGFVASRGGELGPGVYVTRDPELANNFARSSYGGDYGEGAGVLPVYAPRLKEFPGVNEQGLMENGWAVERGKIMDRLRAENGGEWSSDIPMRAEIEMERIAREEGYAGFYVNGRGGMNQGVIFDPSAIRSPFAAFDPARSNSSDLLASWGGLAALPAGAEVARRRAQQK